MTLISVIVPVYRVQGFLRECLDSILASPVADIELIAVDDCSPDDCRTILNEYAAFDPRIRVISTPHNMGLGRARNAGLAIATGEWVWFVDSDDTLTPGSIEAVRDRLTQDNPDVLFIDYAKTYPDREPEPSNLSNLLSKHPPPKIFDLNTWPHVMELMNAAWTKITRRELLTDLKLAFPPGWYEDISWTYQLILGASAMTILDRRCYLYRQRRAGSITATGGPRHFELFDQWARLWQELDPDTNNNAKNLIYQRMVWHYLQVVGNGQRIPGRHRKEFFLRAASDYHRYRVGIEPAKLDRREQLKQAVLKRRAYRTYWLIRILGRTLRHLTRQKKQTSTRHVVTTSRLRYILARRSRIDTELVVYVAATPSNQPGDVALIREAIKARKPETQHIWLHGQPDKSWYDALAKARTIITDTDLPPYYQPRTDTTVLRVFADTPFTAAALDRDKYPGHSGHHRSTLLHQSGLWDAIVTPNAHTTQTVERAWQPHHAPTQTGAPRHHLLSQVNHTDAIDAKRRLGWNPHTPTITYLPASQAQPFNTKTITNAVGDVRIITGHHSNTDNPMAPTNPTFPALPAGASLMDLLLATDVLITDYAPVVGDYLLLDRPIIIYTPDPDQLINQYGAIPDLFAAPPGPLVRNHDELINELTTSGPKNRHRHRRYALRARLGIDDHGHTLDRILDVIYGGTTLDQTLRPSLTPSPLPHNETMIRPRSKENV